MSKYRCPVCGATHKNQPTKCRLCGQDMSGSSTIPAYTGGARQTVQSQSGLGRLAIIGLVIVLGIGLLAVVLGFTGSNSFIDNIREEIPGLEVNQNDGWTALDDPSGGFVAQMPEGREKKFIAFAPAANGRLDQWSSLIGDETDLTISYGKVSKADGQSANAALASYAETWAATLGGKVEDAQETGFQGYPAIEVAVRDLTLADETATARAMMVLRGDTLYVLQSESIYPDQPQYGRLLSGFQFTT
jgi:hypothetical protein